MQAIKLPSDFTRSAKYMEEVTRETPRNSVLRSIRQSDAWYYQVVCGVKGSRVAVHELQTLKRAFYVVEQLTSNLWGGGRKQ
jgi:hypothetical protein